MIQADKFQNALYALNRIMVLLRMSAYMQEDQDDSAKVLDKAEYMVRLIASEKDETGAFRICLQSLIKIDKKYRHALGAFDLDDLRYPW